MSAETSTKEVENYDSRLARFYLACPDSVESAVKDTLTEKAIEYYHDCPNFTSCGITLMMGYKACIHCMAAHTHNPNLLVSKTRQIKAEKI